MKIFCSNWILPISSAPIERGAVVIESDRILVVGARTDITQRFPNVEIIDFGEAAILPGFVNAHTHLELSAMRGFLDDVESDFFSWLRKLTVARAEKMDTDDIRTSTVCGAIEAARAGVTCLGDIATKANESMLALQKIGLRGIVYQEIIGPDNNAAEQKLDDLSEQISHCRGIETNTVRIGVTPHAPYSVSSRLFELVTDFVLAENLPMTIHAAESQNEDDFLIKGSGFFTDFYKAREIAWRVPHLSPIKYLKSLGVLKAKPLLAHCVKVSDEDIEIISETNTSIAHCPKSNAKFGHGIAPLAKFLEKNILTGLGSDSVASNNVCDILEEARFAALLQRTQGSFLEAEKVLHLSTLGGAQALGLDREIGSIEIGKQADLVVINLKSLPPQPVYSPITALVFASSSRDVVLTMVAGRVIFEKGNITTINEIEWREKLSRSAKKLAT